MSSVLFMDIVGSSATLVGRLVAERLSTLTYVTPCIGLSVIDSAVAEWALGPDLSEADKQLENLLMGLLQC